MDRKVVFYEDMQGESGRLHRHPKGYITQAIVNNLAPGMVGKYPDGDAGSHGVSGVFVPGPFGFGLSISRQGVCGKGKIKKY